MPVGTALAPPGSITPSKFIHDSFEFLELHTPGDSSSKRRPRKIKTLIISMSRLGKRQEIINRRRETQPKFHYNLIYIHILSSPLFSGDWCGDSWVALFLVAGRPPRRHFSWGRAQPRGACSFVFPETKTNPTSRTRRSSAPRRLLVDSAPIRPAKRSSVFSFSLSSRNGGRRVLGKNRVFRDGSG